MKHFAWVVLLLSVFLSGCSVPQYHQALAGTPSATLIFPDHKNTMDQSMEFKGFHQNCEPSDGDGQLAFYNLLRPLTKSVKLQADQKIYIKELYRISGMASNFATCWSTASFVPKAGKSYRIDPNISVLRADSFAITYVGASCRINIVDVESGQPADEFEAAPQCSLPKK